MLAALWLFLEESFSPLSLPFCSSYDVTHFLCGVFTSFTGPRPFSHLQVFARNWAFPLLVILGVLFCVRCSYPV